MASASVDENSADEQDQLSISRQTLHNFKETVRRLQAVGNKIEPTDLLVVAVERYQVDGNFYAETGQTDDGQSHHSYDVTLTDGTHLIKCILAAKLNTCVQQNKVYAGCVVRLLDCKVHYNEASLKAESYLIIEGLYCLQINAPALQIENLSFWPGATEHEKNNRPLAASRESYLPLWNDDDPYGGQWENEVTSSKLPRRAIPAIKDIAGVVERWSYRRLQKPYPPLIGKIVSKARLYYYGKSTRPREKWPYQIHLEIADSSGCVSAILWTRLAPKYCNSLHVGNVLLLENYKLKRRYGQHTKPALHNPELRFLDAELSLNSSHPTAEILIVNPSSIPKNIKLPDVKHQFLTRRQLSGAPDKLICDVCGIVTFVGRWERTRNTKKGANNNCFWTWRWVHMIDPTSSEPIILQLYSTAQPIVHDQLRPGTLLVCTQMKVVHQVGMDSRSKQSLYLTTTNESQLYTDNHRQNTYKNEIIIPMLVSWRHSDVVKKILKTSVIGGYYTYPPLPTNVQDYERQHALDNVFRIVPIDSLQVDLESLHYREHRRILVQGHIASVTVVRLSNSQAASTSHTEAPTSVNSSKPSSPEQIISPLQTRTARKRKRNAAIAEPTHTLVLRSRVVTVKQDLRQVGEKTTREVSAKKKKDSQPRQQKQPPPPQQQQEDEEETAEVHVQDVQTETTNPRQQQHIRDVYNIDPQWPALHQRITVIGEPSVSQMALPREYSEGHDDILQRSFGLQPSRIPDDFRPMGKTLDDVPIPTSIQDYYEITLEGLNRMSAVRAVFIPVRTHSDHRTASPNAGPRSFLSELATGTSPPATAENRDTSSASKQRKRGRKAKKKTNQDKPRTDHKQMMAAHFDAAKTQRLIAVLDVYGCGDGQAEIVLNRAYAVD